MIELKLTVEDKESLRQMLSSPGWLVAKRIWDYNERQALDYCGSVKEDHRYFQGLLNGIKGIYSQITGSVSDKPLYAVRSTTDYS
jgi:hypothetical protein